MAITYPVPEDSRWSLYHIDTGEIKPHNRPWPRGDGSEIVGLDSNLVPLMEVVEDQPVYDPATQYIKRTAPVVDIDANTHTHGWEILPRPQEEIDDETEREQLKAVYQDLKNGVGNSTERLVRVERVCAYLLKHLFGAN